MFGIIEIIIVLGIISIQLYLAYKLWFKIKMYRAIFDFEDLPTISQKNISKEVIQTGDVNQILQYVDNGEGVINITFLNYTPKSKVRISGNFNIFNSETLGTYNGVPLDREIVSWFARVNSSFPVLLGINAQLRGFYFGP